MENENIKNKFIADVENIIKEKTQQNFEYNNYFEKCSDTKEIIPILQEINKYFLQNFMIQINDELKIYPVEVEIYYYNDKNFKDNLCHRNELQKKHFGQLYFHRVGQPRAKDKTALIDTSYYGGVDVCFSDSDNYYLSILIRSAYIKHRNNKKGKIISGIHRIVNKITDELEFSLEGNRNITITYNLKIRDDYKYNAFINHCRINNTQYFKDIEEYKDDNFAKYELNTFINDKEIIEELAKKIKDIYWKYIENRN